MLVVTNRVKKVLRWPVTELWFPREGDTYRQSPGKPFEIVRAYHGSHRVSTIMGRWRKSQTLISDLTRFSTLRSSLNSALRREIDKALADPSLTLRADWTCAEFLKFSLDSDPNNPGPVSLERLENLRRMGKLTLHAIEGDGLPLCAHAYLEDFPRSLLLHTYTARKSFERNDPRVALIARANKGLHYQDMQHLHQREFTQLDWGGYWGKPGYGPDTFKQRFRGELAESWSVDVLLTPLQRTLSFDSDHWLSCSPDSDHPRPL